MQPKKKNWHISVKSQYARRIFLLFVPSSQSLFYFSKDKLLGSPLHACDCECTDITFERPGHVKDPHMLNVNILIVPIALQFMVLNMPLELMTTQRVVSLRLNLDSALVSSLGSQYLWGRHAWILSRLESSWSASQQTIMVIPITWLLRTAIISAGIFVTSWQGTQCQNGWIDLQE